MITLTEHLYESLEEEYYDELNEEATETAKTATGFADKIKDYGGKAKTFVSGHRKGVAIGAGVAAAGAAAYGIHKLRQRNKAKKAAQQQN